MGEGMAEFWAPATSGDRFGFASYQRHYSARNKRPRVRQFVGPGEKMVLVGLMCNAVFAWRKARFRADCQVGVECAIFRNESGHRSSDMIREAMDAAWEKWPGERLFTLINPRRVRSTNPGFCFLCAGWRRVGTNGKGHLILEAEPCGTN